MTERLLRFDTYERRARLAPALLTIVPFAANVIAWFPEGILGWAGLSTLLGMSGGTFLIAQLARERGKVLEHGLWKSWGGNPAVQRLRHGGAEGLAVKRRHARLKALIGDIEMPSPEEEQANPVASEAVYEECVRYLRSKTRDRTKYRLLYLENCNYGFWRNLLGLKPVGITISGIAAATMGGSILAQGWRSSPPVMMIVLLLDTLLLLMWVGVVGKTPVKNAATAYADRLIDSIGNLAD